MRQPPNERAYFESYYKATVEGCPTDLTTIGRVTELEARFHYNSVGNAILHALARLTPPPPAAMVGGWREVQKRRRLRHFDVGVGTGHWIDFMREVCYIAESVGAEINADIRGSSVTSTRARLSRSSTSIWPTPDSPRRSSPDQWTTRPPSA